MHFIEINLKNLYNLFEEVTFEFPRRKITSEAKQATVYFKKILQVR
jgi:hypothetical protein